LFLVLLALIKKNSILQSKINVFAINNQEGNPFINHLLVNSYLDLLDSNFETLFTEKTDIGIESLYAVCTNGKKDKCCSKFGIQVFDALRNLDKDVWQCMHLGGDRFAPNILHLPYSHLFGHLNIEEVKELYESTRGNKIFIRRYRGACCYGKYESVLFSGQNCFCPLLLLSSPRADTPRPEQKCDFMRRVAADLTLSK
jgi:hypothetical protein